MKSYVCLFVLLIFGSGFAAMAKSEKSQSTTRKPNSIVGNCSINFSKGGAEPEVIESSVQIPFERVNLKATGYDIKISTDVGALDISIKNQTNGFRAQSIQAPTELVLFNASNEKYEKQVNFVLHCSAR